MTTITMVKIFRIQTAMPAYALCVCLALSCNNSDLLPQRFGDGEIGFAVNREEVEPLTKGIPASSDNIATLYADNVSIAAFYGTDEYIPTQPLWSPSTENDRWHTSQSYFWPESGSLDFWSWAPADLDVAFNASRSVLSFRYSLPAPDHDAKQDAVGQQDIVLASAHADRNTYGGGVPLAFSHPLSSIVFRGGTMRDGIIRRISLRNVSGSGDCNFDGSAFAWNVADESLTFTQIFDAPVAANDTGRPITFAGSTMGERSFMMIPQTLGDDAFLDVVFDDGMEVRTYSHSLAGGVWKAGTSHTYTISLPSDPASEISVEETFDGFSKTNVSIRNSSEYNVYLRVMIEANWVDADGCIVAPCDITREGTLEGFNVSSTGGRWTRYSDGFYYYKKAVRPGRKTFDLFSRYIPGPPPVDGSHLEMTVAVQAVEYDVNQKRAKAAWGRGIPITGSIE